MESSAAAGNKAAVSMEMTLHGGGRGLEEKGDDVTDHLCDLRCAGAGKHGEKMTAETSEKENKCL